MKFFEANFDGLVGPTHNYAGLSIGNVASLSNAKNSSSPRQAAKQGLSKMKALHDLGMVQGVLAPQERPDVYTLRRLGFTGSDAQVIEKAAKQAPGRGLPPVHLWNPEHCGEIDIVIGRDGVWMHEGSPIGRPELVRLFSTVLTPDYNAAHRNHFHLDVGPWWVCR